MQRSDRNVVVTPNLSKGRTIEKKKRLAELVTRYVVEKAGLGHDAVCLLLYSVPLENMSFGGGRLPADPRHTAHLRIFTPDREVPFAGHLNIGTAFLLARQRVMTGEPLPERFTFEEAAGLVTIDLVQDDGSIVGAELLSPQPLVRHTEVNPALAAACLSLAEADVRTDAHVPQVVSVGLPFLVLELASREVLRRTRPDRSAHDALFPLDGARAVYANVRDVGDEEAGHGSDLHSRMFTWRLVEDPATGGATAAATALLAELRGTEVRLLAVSSAG